MMAGVGRATKAERGLEFLPHAYRGDAGDSLRLRATSLPSRIWEPACGDGAIVCALIGYRKIRLRHRHR